MSAEQLELSQAAADDVGTVTTFDEARARFPNCRFLLVLDRRASSALKRFLVAIDRRSSWFDLLPEEQVVSLRDIDPNEPPRHTWLVEYDMPAPAPVWPQRA